MKRYLLTGIILVTGFIVFGQEKPKTETTEAPKQEIKHVPKATQNKALVKKAQQQKKMVKRAQIKRRQANIAAQRTKAIQRRRK